MRGRLLGTCAALLLVVAAVPLQAHHSFVARFDRNQQIRLTGAVTKIEWANPHVSLSIDVTDPETGHITNWSLEMGTPSVIARAGWRRSSIKVGEMIVVEGFRAKDGSDHGRVLAVTLMSTGKRLGTGAASTERTHDD